MVLEDTATTCALGIVSMFGSTVSRGGELGSERRFKCFRA